MKNIFYLLIAGGVLALAHKFISPVRRFVSSFTSDTASALETQASELIDEIQKDVDMTTREKSNSDIIARANSLFSGMTQPGTDEQLVRNQILDLKGADLVALVKDFGVKEEKVFGYTFFVGNLFDWLTWELGDSDLKTIKQHFNKYGIWN